MITGAVAESLAKLVPKYLFRPRLHVVMSLSNDARRLRRRLSKTASMFQYTQARDAEPSAFLEGLGRVAWLT